MTYNDLNEITNKTTGAISVTYTYDNDGLLTNVQYSNGYAITMTYDQQGRQTSASDNLGGTVAYTLDENGLPSNTTISSGNNLQLVTNKVFDGLGRIQQAWTNNPNQKFTYAYDGNSKFRPASQTNPRGYTKTLSYNAGTLQAEAGQGDSYTTAKDVDDNVTSINVNGKYYQMAYNDFAEILSYDSPNTGVDSYAYSVQNRTVSKTDAQGITHTTQYDAIGRPLSVTSGSLQKTFSYDSAQVGKLSSAQNNTSSISYAYNGLGNVIQKSQTVAGNTKVLNYGYDTQGQLTSITYPSGLVVNYNYNNGVVTSITASGAVSGTIISNINYQAATFEPLSWSWGNGFTRSKSMDTGGKITSINDGPLSQGYLFGSMFNLGQLTENGYTTTYDYDDGLRLIDAFKAGVFRTQYGYNTTNKARSWQDANEYSQYSYDQGTDQLMNWNSDAGDNLSLQYDNRGNVTSTGRVSLYYNAQNNVSSATRNGQTFNYTYNAFGERVSKSGPGVNLQFLYNDSHQLIGEYSGSTIVAEYIYFGQTPIALFKNNQLYFIHTDHLATPRAITATGGSIVWKWDNTDPFGKNPAQNLGIIFNLRFMGNILTTKQDYFITITDTMTQRLEDICKVTQLDWLEATTPMLM